MLDSSVALTRWLGGGGRIGCLEIRLFFSLQWKLVTETIRPLFNYYPSV
ncbi:unnamed protein product [Ixodes hexagonus]